MKRIGKVLHSLFSRLPFFGTRRDEASKTATVPKPKTAPAPKPKTATVPKLKTAPAPQPATAPPPTDADRLLASRLRRTIEDRRLFLRPDLSLAGVATELNMPADAAERIFAHFIGENFHRYLDELRIAYAAVLFMGHESHLYSLEKIGTVCGFPDNAAFTDACWNLTGMTPELIREFTRGRKTLKGLFLHPPAYMATLSPDALEAEKPDE